MEPSIPSIQSGDANAYFQQYRDQFCLSYHSASNNSQYSLPLVSDCKTFSYDTTNLYLPTTNIMPPPPEPKKELQPTLQYPGNVIASDGNWNKPSSFKPTDFSNILRKVDSTNSIAVSSASNGFLSGINNIVNAGASIVKSALNHMNDSRNSFNPYGPPKAKVSRPDNGNDYWSNSPTNKNSTPLYQFQNSPTNNNITIALNSTPTNAKSSISPLVSNMKLHNTSSTINEEASNLLNSSLRNGSFNVSSVLNTPKSHDTSLNFSILSSHNGSLSSLNSSYSTPTSVTKSASSQSNGGWSFLNCSSPFGSSSFKQPKIVFGKVEKNNNSKQNEAMTLFFTKTFCFSNHFPCNKLIIDDVSFTCTEQYYMYYKARVFGDLDSASAIMSTNDPKAMKRIGSCIEGFDEKMWSSISILVMVIASVRKYEQNADLRRQLFETVDTVLVEANPTDERWGVGLSIESDRIREERNWRGKNIMGKLLTRLRNRLLERPEFAAERRQLLADGEWARANTVYAYAGKNQDDR